VSWLYPSNENCDSGRSAGVRHQAALSKRSGCFYGFERARSMSQGATLYQWISDRHALCAFLTWLHTNDWQGDFPDKYRAVGIDKIRSPQQLHLTPNFIAFTRERAAFRHWPERTKPLELPLARF